MFVNKKVLYLHTLVLIFLLIPSSLNASWFTAALNTMTGGAVTLAEELSGLVGCKKDTKLTRVVPYGVEMGVLKTAKVSAELALAAAEKLTDPYFDAAEETAKVGVAAAQEFLKGLESVSNQAMEGAAAASQGVLEGIKQGTTGILKGTSWVAGNVLNQFDINEIAFNGDLQQLAGGTLGNVHVTGKLVSEFDEELILNPKNIAESIANLVEKLVSKLGNAVFSPVTSRAKQINRELLSDPEVKKGLIEAGLSSPAEIKAALAAQADVQNKLNAIKAQEEKMNAALKQAEADMKRIAAMKPRQLLDYVQKIPSTSGYSAFDLRARNALDLLVKELRRNNKNLR
jgi:hypothetical protein